MQGYKQPTFPQDLNELQDKKHPHVCSLMGEVASSASDKKKKTDENEKMWVEVKRSQQLTSD